MSEKKIVEIAGQEDFTIGFYENILKEALKAGYNFEDFSVLKGKCLPPRPICLLRHDVDNELNACTEMAQLESNLGVKSTYFLMTRSSSYNLLCVESLKQVEHLLKLGHEIGLHFMGELTENYDANEIVDRVCREMRLVENEFGINVHAVSFHQPTEKMLRSDLVCGAAINTYNKTQMKDFTYVSDSNMNWRREHPFEIFKSSLCQHLQLLIHPMWWTEQPMMLPEKWRRVLEINNKSVVNHWIEREQTFKDFGINSDFFDK